MKIFVLLAVALLPGVAAASRGFHPAGSEPEKVLEALLARAQKEGFSEYLLRPKAEDAQLDAELSMLVTPRLMQAWRETEQNLVYSQCGGQYIEGRECGVQLNPVTCLKFQAPQFHFRTDSGASFSEGERNVLIAVQLPGARSVLASYQLLRIGNQWKVDGLDCTLGGVSFNY